MIQSLPRGHVCKKVTTLNDMDLKFVPFCSPNIFLLPKDSKGLKMVAGTIWNEIHDLKNNTSVENLTPSSKDYERAFTLIARMCHIPKPPPGSDEKHIKCSGSVYFFISSVPSPYEPNNDPNLILSLEEKKNIKDLTSTDRKESINNSVKLAHENNVTINFIQVPMNYVGVTRELDDYLVSVVRKTAGEIIDCSSSRTDFNDGSIEYAIWNICTRPRAVNVSVKIRTSDKLKVTQLFCPWADPHVKGGGRGSYSNLFRVPECSDKMTVSFNIEQTDDLDCSSIKKSFCQVVVRYTDTADTDNPRKVRVITGSYELTQSIASVFRYYDVYAGGSAFIKSYALELLRERDATLFDTTKASSKTSTVKSLGSSLTPTFFRREHYLLTRDYLIDNLASALLTYRIYIPSEYGHNQQLVLPETLRLLPLMIQSALKLLHQASPKLLVNVLAANPSKLFLMLYPRLFLISVPDDVLIENKNLYGYSPPARSRNKEATQYHFDDYPNMDNYLEELPIKQYLSQIGMRSRNEGLYLLPPRLESTLRSIVPHGVYLLFVHDRSIVYFTKEAIEDSWNIITDGLYDDINVILADPSDYPVKMGHRIRRCIHTLQIKFDIMRTPIVLLFENLDSVPQGMEHHSIRNLLVEDAFNGTASYCDFLIQLHQLVTDKYKSL